MPNFTKIVEISEDESPKTVTLSATSLNLCLALVEHYAQKGFWFTNDDTDWRLDAVEQDQADSIQALAIQELLQEVSMIPVGMIVAWPSYDLPNGWLLCDGTEYQITASNQALYDVIGTTFGGSVGSSFHVPNLVGRYVMGQDGDNAEYLGETLGAKMQTLVPQHNHGEKVGGGSAAYLTATNGARSAVAPSTTTSTTRLTTDNAGEASGVDQRPPTLCLNYIIYAGA